MQAGLKIVSAHLAGDVRIDAELLFQAPVQFAGLADPGIGEQAAEVEPAVTVAAVEFGDRHAADSHPEC